MAVRLFCGDALGVLSRNVSDDSVDSIITDPPYATSFMGKYWDNMPSVDLWKEVLRVAKPGAYLLSFGGTRTSHRLACAIEDAGWEIRDTIMWVYGSGFPKSLDVSKAIDKAAGAKRGVVGESAYAKRRPRPTKGTTNPEAQYRFSTNHDETRAASPDALRWEGWGTALKPAWEPIIVARKPFKGSVANNVLKYGTGAINTDGCRVGDVGGRWPANFIHDGSDEVLAGLGHAARFFYCAKASKADRDEGLEDLPLVAAGAMAGRHDGSLEGSVVMTRNHHPTVKPNALMRWLVRLVTQPGGVVLDPFMGSGSTGKAAVMEGFGFMGIDIDREYAAIARLRIKHALGE